MLSDLKKTSLKRLKELHFERLAIVESFKTRFNELYTPNTFYNRSIIKSDIEMKNLQVKLSNIKTEIKQMNFVMKMLKYFKHKNSFRIWVSGNVVNISGYLRNSVVHDFIVEDSLAVLNWMKYSSFDMFTNRSIGKSFSEYLDKNIDKIYRKYLIINLDL